MYPRKNMPDYISEMNRYPQTEGESDLFQSPLPRTRSFNQSSMAQSSSSTETSPESFPDLSPLQFPPEFRPEGTRKPAWYPRNQWNREESQFRPGSYESFRAEFESRRPNVYIEGHSSSRAFNHMQPETHYGSHQNHYPDLNNLVLAEHIYESPVRRQRPIIGRKIMATTETPLQTINKFPIWQPDLEQTPPKSLEHKYTPNIYELFPSDNRGFEFPTPAKTPTSPLVPSRISQSPGTSTPCVTPPARSLFSPRMSLFKEPLVGPGFNNHGASKMCTFCRKNGETPCVYNTHSVKEKIGNRNVVTCPILRSHVCSTCGVSGDDAHTITYCPVLRSGNNGQPLQSTTITLKNTRVKSNGRRRY